MYASDKCISLPVGTAATRSPTWRSLISHHYN